MKYKSKRIWEIGVSGANTQIDYNEIAGKHVKVQGEVLEPHTQYHWGEIMIMDGYQNLEVIE